MGLHVLPDLGRVDLDVDDLRLRREVLQAPGHAVVEAHADADKEIRLADRDVVPVHAVHAGHTQVQRVRAGEAADAEQRRDHRDVRLLRQLPHLGVGVRDDHAVAGEDDRSLRRSGLAPIAFASSSLSTPLVYGLVAAQLHLVRPVELAGVLQDIARDIDEHRPGTAGRGDVEGFLHRARDLVDVRTSSLCLVIGMVMPWMSASWKPSRPIKR